MSRRALLACACAAAFILAFFGACHSDPAPMPAPTPPRAPLAGRGILSAPVAVTVDYARTFVATRFEGAAEYTRTVGSLAWGDTYLFWQQPDPAPVDYYEVYTTTNVPYFSVPVSATLALTTTAQGAVFPGSPARFNPVPQNGTQGARSDFDFYTVRAVNAAGASEPSWTIGVVIYSLIGPPYDWETNPGGMPTPLPTRGPSPTPVPPVTLTPVPTGTPGPSPTPPGG